MPLLTDLLASNTSSIASNTSDIASNTTAVASAGGKSKYLGSVEVTNTTTTYVEIDSTLITSSYTDYFIRLKSTSEGWPSGTSSSYAYMKLQGYLSNSGYWSNFISSAGFRNNTNGQTGPTSWLLEGFYIQDIFYGSDVDINLIADVKLIKPLTTDSCSVSYETHGADNNGGGHIKYTSGVGHFNTTNSDQITAIRFTTEGGGSSINWPQGTVAHVYGIVDS